MFELDFYGSYLLLANRQDVWRALNDASVLKSAIPGCHHIAWVSETSLDLKIKVNLGIIHPVFAGQLELSDVDPAKTYTLSGRGHGRILGLAHGSAFISLRDVSGNDFLSLGSQFISELNAARQILTSKGDSLEEITWLKFSAKGGASPRIMALGNKIVGGSAQKIIDRFFVRLADAMNTRVHILSPDDYETDLPPSLSLDRT